MRTWSLDMRRWWREFWSGRQNGIDGYNDAYNDCASMTDAEIFSEMKKFDPPEDRYEVGWIKGAVNFLIYKRNWHRDDLSEKMGW